MENEQLKLAAKLTALEQVAAIALAIAHHSAGGTSDALNELRDACIIQWQDTAKGVHEERSTSAEAKALQAEFDVHFEDAIFGAFSMASGMFKSIRDQHDPAGPDNG